MVIFGKGYEDSDGLEYAIYQGLDHILVVVIGLWAHKTTVKTSEYLSAMRAKMNEGSATSAAHALDKLIGTTLMEELKEAESMNEVRVFMTISRPLLNVQ